MPKQVFTTAWRVVLVLNGKMSFTLNVGLLFTPLFGDYTIVGRFIGFTIRIIEILIGTVIVIIAIILAALSPLAWLVLPLAVAYKLGLWVVALIAGLFAAWALKTRNEPEKEIDQVTHEDIRPAVRPTTVPYLKGSQQHPIEALKILAKTREIKYLLRRSEINLDTFIGKCSEIPKIERENLERTALDYAKEHETRYIEPEHLFLSLLKNTPKINSALSVFNTTLRSLEESARWVVELREKSAKRFLWQEGYEMPPAGGIGKGMTGRVTPKLDAVSQDLTKMVRKGLIRKIVGRQEEVEEISKVLTGDVRDLLIIGEPGSGKTSLIGGVAHKIMTGTKYKSLRNKRIVSLETGTLISGADTPGKIAERITKVMEEVAASGDIILFIDEMHALMTNLDDTNAEAATFYNVLEPHLIKKGVTVIGATTNASYRKYIEPNGAFSRLFQTLKIPEMGQEDTIEVLKGRVGELEKKYKVIITYPALQAIVRLSKKLIHERVFPDKAIDILIKTAISASGTDGEVTVRSVTKEVSKMTNVPLSAISQDEAKKLLNIEQEMGKMVVGQANALKEVGAAVRRARAGVRNEEKPIASFLFVGTTGVGKTQTAKALAKVYFGDKKAMIRVDMSEYQQADSISRLLGAPDGSTKGILTEKVRTTPFSLILLDEIEKAHQNILLTFLQVLDEGRLTDSSGTTVDFTNTIIIATSNVGTRVIQKMGSNTPSEREVAALQEVRKEFAPEFLNRFNGIVVFNPLTHDDMLKITKLLLDDVKENMKGKGIALKFTSDLVEKITEKGYDPAWGARPLARLIEKTVESSVSNKIISEEIQQGDEITIGEEVLGTV